MRAVFLAGLLLAAGAFWLARSRAGGGLLEVPPGSFGTLDVRTLKALLEAPERGFLLVNVHVPYEGEIPGTDLGFPYDRVALYAPRLLPERDRPVVVYCRSGAMSRAAVEALVRLGYTRVYDVPGGMRAWKAAGYPLVFEGGKQ